MDCPIDKIISIATDVLTAIGTIAVAILAIWGDRIKSWLSPAILKIEPVENTGIHGSHLRLNTPSNILVPGLNRDAMWYVLKVVNKKPWMSSKNCRVMLVAISKKGPDGIYRPEPFKVPRQFWWAPSEFMAPLATINKEQVFDFGFIQANGMFSPTLYSTPSDFPGHVRKNESVRYSLEIDANNFTSPIQQVFEISWDGEWDPNPDIMSRHLVIKELSRNPEINEV